MGTPATETVESILDSITNAQRRADASTLCDLMTEATGETPKVWSSSTIGFGEYHYKYLKTGEEGDFFKVGFAPRNDRITIYVMSGLRGFEDILERLGPHTAGKSTVHLKRLQALDRAALTELITECVRHLDEVEALIGAIPRMSDIPPRTT